MKIFRAGLGHQTQRAATLAALSCVVQRRGNFHFLQRIGIRQRHRIEVGEVKIVDVDAVERNAVVAGALTIHAHVRGAASGGAHVRRFAGNAGRKRAGTGSWATPAAECLAFDVSMRLSCLRARRIDQRWRRFDVYCFLDLSGFQADVLARRLGNVHLDAGD